MNNSPWATDVTDLFNCNTYMPWQQTFTCQQKLLLFNFIYSVLGKSNLFHLSQKIAHSCLANQLQMSSKLLVLNLHLFHHDWLCMKFLNICAPACQVVPCFTDTVFHTAFPTNSQYQGKLLLFNMYIFHPILHHKYCYMFYFSEKFINT